MARILYIECARLALLAKQNTTYWIAVGRTTAWPDDDAPPSETRVDELIEPIIYVRGAGVTLCTPVVSGGDLLYKGQSYQSVTDEDAIDELARFIYMSAEIRPASGQPYGTYRQRAVVCNVTPTLGHESDGWLAPANVLDPGTVCLIENDVPNIQSLERSQVLPMVLEFR